MEHGDSGEKRKRKTMMRLVYLLYYLRQTPPAKLGRFLRYASEVSGRSRFVLLCDAVGSVFRYNISLLDYFHFRFYRRGRAQRLKWAGTGTLYEFQLRMNPRGAREVLEDKVRFLEHFRDFYRRKWMAVEEVAADVGKVEQLLGNPSGRVVFKGRRGQAGREVEVAGCGAFTPAEMVAYMRKKRFGLVEEGVLQHPLMAALSPSGLNTVRLITHLVDGEVTLVGARLRISVHSPVDNMAAGNMAAVVDMATGRVTGPGVYSDITRKNETVHPVTGHPIPGFMVPFWQECTDLAVRAARHTPGNRSVGWDIAITPMGPELIEGNHNWCKLLWQLPAGKGLKSQLDALA